MEMFNKKELDKRIGPLKKSKSLYDLEQVEGYLKRRCSEYGIESSYDVMAEEFENKLSKITKVTVMCSVSSDIVYEK